MRIKNKKVLYNPLKTKGEKIRFEMMRIMANDICFNSVVEEAYPAVVGETKGIYATTDKGGKKFWSFDELLYYFARKNGEEYRVL